MFFISIGNIYIKDLVHKKSLYPFLLKPNNVNTKNVGKFTYKKWNNLAKKNAELSFSMDAFEFVFFNSFVMELVDYFRFNILQVFTPPNQDNISFVVGKSLKSNIHLLRLRKKLSK